MRNRERKRKSERGMRHEERRNRDLGQNTNSRFISVFSRAVKEERKD
jgi:hypothetical protein